MLFENIGDYKRFMILERYDLYEEAVFGIGWAFQPSDTVKRIITAEEFAERLEMFQRQQDLCGNRVDIVWRTVNCESLPCTVAYYEGEELKHEYTFSYVSEDELLASAGYRETEVVKHADTFDIRREGGSVMLHLYTEDTGVTHSGIYDLVNRYWRG